MMDTLYITMMALVIGLVAFSTSFWGGIYRCLTKREIMTMVGAFVVFQAGLFWLGMLSGKSFSISLGWLSLPFANAILLTTGLKLIYSAFRTRPEHKSFNLSNIKELIAVAFASSLNAFMIGLGYGMLRPMQIYFLAGISVAVVIFSFTGVLIGKKQGSIIYTTFAGAMAGAFLIILAALLILDYYQMF
jgi:putative Mn2+ efflux pump MntP